jgi:acyl-CoA synthetase (AMP-forming)/AMP-acid ligase II
VNSGEALLGLLTDRPGSSTALILPESGERLDTTQLAGHIDDVARQLAGIGVKRGDRVALALPNGPEFIELLLAITAMGAAAAPLNPAYTVDEFAFYLDDIKPLALLLPAGQLAPARAAAAAVEVTPRVVDVGSRGGGPPGLDVDGQSVTASAYEPGDPNDVAMILHTSGTTSRPKQVPLLQRNLSASARTIGEHYRLGTDDVSYCAMPLFHVHGLVASVLASLAAGGCVVIPRRLAPRPYWQQARDHGITWVSAGPTLHQMLLEKIDEAGPPETVRFVRSCSSALPTPLLHRVEDIYQAPMLEAYGMTEASHQIASNPLPPERRIPGSVGVPTGTEVAVIDPARRFLADGERGELVVRGDTITPGYLNNPSANHETFFDGWFRTGDLGVLDGGYVQLVGRLKEMILRGGENISPAEIEDVLRAHPAVTDAACFGVPDDKYGELVGAAVVVSEDVEPGLLIEHCRERLTAFKVPERVHVVADLPRTATGKPQRRRVAEMLGGSSGTSP